MDKKRGFTLIEMIVVIGIIGVLIALGMLGSISRVRKNAIDTKRKSNIENIRGAITMYYSSKASWPAVSNGWDNFVNDLTDDGFLTNNILSEEDGDATNGPEYSVCGCGAADNPSCNPICQEANNKVRLRLCIRTEIQKNTDDCDSIACPPEIQDAGTGCCCLYVK